MRKAKMTERRDRQLNLSLTDRELEEIKRRAEAVGMRVAHFGRAALFDVERQPAPQPAAVTDRQRLVYQQLARIGANLNQLMKYCWSTGYPPPADLEPLIADIRQIIARYLQ